MQYYCKPFTKQDAKNNFEMYIEDLFEKGRREFNDCYDEEKQQLSAYLILQEEDHSLSDCLDGCLKEIPLMLAKLMLGHEIEKVQIVRMLRRQATHYYKSVIDAKFDHLKLRQVWEWEGPSDNYIEDYGDRRG